MSFETIKTAMAELDEDTLLESLKSAVDGGEDASELFAALQQGMSEVGDLFEEGEYFVGDLIFAGEIMNGAIDILKPALTGGKSSAVCGRLILCTVKNDLHDIGKGIVCSMLEANGFEVLDLGVDADPAVIVETAIKENIGIVALSGVLTLSLDSMRETVDAFTAAGLRDKVKIIVGGAPLNEDSFKSIGADAWALSPQKTAEICKSWL